MKNITPRQLSILNEIVKQYIQTGEPVASKVIGEKIGVSSATVRNEMTILTELEYLFQTHTSSGRAPSLNAFKLYVERMVNPAGSSWQISRIAGLLERDYNTAENLLHDASVTLSDILISPVLLSVDISEQTPVKDVQVIVINSNTVLLCVILSKVYIKSQVCRLSVNLNLNIIENINEILKNYVISLPLCEINLTLIQTICAKNAAYTFTITPLLETLIDITREILIGNFFLEGEHKLFMTSNGDLDILRELMIIMSERTLITQLTQKDFNNFTVLFGDEIAPQLSCTSVILAKYKAYSASGTVGVLGPLRMDYEHIMPSINYFTKQLGEKIELMWD